MKQSVNVTLLIGLAILALAWTGPLALAEGPQGNPSSEATLAAQKLIAAAAEGDMDSVKGLLGKGANVNGRDDAGLTPFLAARLHGEADMSAYLVKQGANAKASMPAPGILMDRFLAERVNPEGAGMAVLVAREGKIVFEKGYGLADIAGTVPVTPATAFRIGSVTKQFTAAAILKLQEAGKLHLTDKLSKYFPEFPGGDGLTLANLITHTSGLHDFTEEADFLESVTKPTTQAELIASIERFPPDFKPGEKWSYSNSNYVILGSVVEKVSGQSYDDYMRQTFFAPLGMNSTGAYHNDHPPSPMAIGYGYDGDSVAKALDWDMSWAAGAGSLYSTAEDLFRWNEALFGHKVLADESLAAAFATVVTPDNQNDEHDTGYGYGWAIDRFRGARVVWHNGALNGFYCCLMRLPEKNLTVVVLTNSFPFRTGTGPEWVAHELIEFCVGADLAPLPAATSPPAAVNASPAAIAAVVGRYEFKNAVMTVTQKGGRIFAQLGLQPKFEIFPRSDTEFFWKAVNAQITFVKDPSGLVIGAVHHQGGRSLQVKRLPDVVEVELSDAQSGPILGVYEVDGTGRVRATISRKDGRLYVQLTGQPRFEMGATSDTELFVRQVNAQLTVVRDAAGQVTAVIHHQNGREREWTRKPSP